MRPWAVWFRRCRVAHAANTLLAELVPRTSNRGRNASIEAKQEHDALVKSLAIQPKPAEASSTEQIGETL
jgi:hypothetical protein